MRRTISFCNYPSLRFRSGLKGLLLFITLNSILLFLSLLLQQSNNKVFHHGESKSFSSINILSSLNTSNNQAPFSAILTPAEAIKTLSGFLDNLGSIPSTSNMHGYDVDIVYTWVNGSDPKHAKATSTKNSTIKSAENEVSDSRFMDNQELKYSLRSIYKFAPWARQIFIVTNGQIPNWLNINHPKIHVVPHSTIFTNQSHLPTFSSPAIESHLHQIPGLAEHFIYFNDDVLLGQPSYPSDFYTPGFGQKVYLSYEAPDCSEGCKTMWVGDGNCDLMCNNTACHFDLGDCLNTNATSSNNGNSNYFWQSNVFNPDTSGKSCAASCIDSWIGDRYCDVACKTPECGMDGGDCGIEMVYLSIPGFNLNLTHVSNTLDKDPPIFKIGNTKYGDDINFASAIYLNLSSIVQTNQITEIGFSEPNIIRTITLSQKAKTMIILFQKFDANTPQTISYKSNNNNNENQINDEQSINSENNNSSTNNTTETIPSQVPMDIKNILNISSEIPISSKDDHSNKKGISPLFTKNVLITFSSTVPNEAENKEWFLQLAISIYPNEKLEVELKTIPEIDHPPSPIPDTNKLDQEDEQMLPMLIDKRVTELRNIIREEHRATRKLFSTTEENEQNIDSNLKDFKLEQNNQTIKISNNDDIILKGTSYSTAQVLKKHTKYYEKHLISAQKQISEYFLKHGLDWKDDSDLDSTLPTLSHRTRNQIERYIKMLQLEDRERKLLNNPRNRFESRSRAFESRKLMDAFGESLIHVGILMNKAFGPDTRHVIAHMPHYYQKSVLERLVNKWPEEFDITSSHTFREGNDMQHAASYFQFLMHERIDYNFSEVFEKELDTNGDGILDVNELRTIGSIMVRSPKTQASSNFRSWSNWVTTPSLDNPSEPHLHWLKDCNDLWYQWYNTKQNITDKERKIKIDDSPITSEEKETPRKKDSFTTLKKSTETVIDGEKVTNNTLNEGESTNILNNSLKLDHSSSNIILNLSSPIPVSEQLKLKKMPQNFTMAKEDLKSCKSAMKPLENHYKARLRNKYEHGTQTNVAFYMLRSNVSTILPWLDSLRYEKNRYICLNDNINHSDPSSIDAIKALQEYYLSILPDPSPYELPEGQTNQYLYVDDLIFAQSKIHTKKSNVIIFSVTIIIFLLCLIICLSRKNEPRLIKIQ